MNRPIAYDLSHVIARLNVLHPSGIDRVDHAFARHFVQSSRPDIVACRYARGEPTLLDAATAQAIVADAESGWREETGIADDTNFAVIAAWLEGAPLPLQPPVQGKRHRASAAPLKRPRWPFRPRPPSVPRNSIYLNVAQFWLEHAKYFEWIKDRPDVRPVFFVHDLLPLDYPEYFPAGESDIFRRRISTMIRHGAGYIVSTGSVRERLRAALAAAKRFDVPIHVGHLPSPLANSDGGAYRQAGNNPYFVFVATIEPRKNHLLILNIWRELAKAGSPVPKLVLVGSSGWEHEQVSDLLERCEAIRPHVFKAANLSSQGLAHLIRGAQAVLLPSFDEGYGLPIVEALSLGTPVIASDIATFREVSQGCGLLLSPIDGIGWKSAIERFAARNKAAWSSAREHTQAFAPPDWERYFGAVEAFLDDL